MAALSVAVGIGLLILALFLLLVSLPVEIRLSIRLSQRKPRVSLSVGYSIRGHRLVVFNVRPAVRKSARPPTPDSVGKARSGREVLSFVGEQYSRLAERYPAIREFLLKSARAIAVTELSLRVWIGTGDAFETAMLAGGLRAASGIALSLGRRWGLKLRTKPCVAIWPVYEKAHLALALDTTLSVRPIMVVAIAPSLLRVVKGQAPFAVVGRRRGWNTIA